MRGDWEGLDVNGRVVGRLQGVVPESADEALAMLRATSPYRVESVRRALPCPACDGTGVTVDGRRDESDCAACDGTGDGVACACGGVVPSGSCVTHDEACDEATGDGEAVHTPERCACYAPRDRWTVTERGGATESGRDLPEWCEPYVSGRQS